MQVVSRITEQYSDFIRYKFSVQSTNAATKTRKYRGFIDEEGFCWRENLETGEITPRKRSEIERSMRQSIERSKNELEKVILANDWDYFVTLTFDKDKVDRFNDLAVYGKYKNFCKWIQRNLPEMWFATVPERHKSGAIHFHLMVGGATAEELRLVDSGKVTCSWAQKKACSAEYYEKNKAKHTNKPSDGQVIYNVGAFNAGFSTATKIINKEAAANYILKYLNKDMGSGEIFKKRYHVNKKAKRASISRETYICDYLTETGFKISRFAGNRLYIEGLSDMFLFKKYVNDDRNVIWYDYYLPEKAKRLEKERAQHESKRRRKEDNERLAMRIDQSRAIWADRRRNKAANDQIKAAALENDLFEAAEKLFTSGEKMFFGSGEHED